ncbi:MAG: gamma-glutamyltransferase [Hyphomicrobiales bacterium]|nr:gamma-glutamyltransferase [Hyphomicrobiales bacterium]
MTKDSQTTLRRTIAALVCCGLMVCALPIQAQESAPIIAGKARILPALARHGMVVAQEEKAARVGLEFLKMGGNAVDAAVATGFAMAVTLPRAGNLGGGGFMLVHLARENRDIALDYRETAPAAATPDMFLNAEGEADPRKSRDSGLGIGTPGTVAGLAYALAHWGSGKFGLADILRPAIKLAHEGFVIEGDLADSLPQAAGRLGRWEASRRVFFHPDGKMFAAGETLVQPDLAATLEKIAAEGPKGFYEGATAQKIAAAVQAAGGRMTADDLAAYAPVERPVVRGTYRGREIVSMPPPSSGGVHLIELLNIMENFPISETGPQTAATIHVMTEAMKLAFADRAEWLADPDFVNVPVAGLISKKYAKALAAEISTQRARPAAEIKHVDPAPFEGDQTTHFSVVDGEGNAVANTYTLNFSYGLGLVADGTGVLLNNELDDFSAKPGSPNAFGLVGGAANAPGARKRPLSSMTPTFVLKDGKIEIVTGSPGGPRIITTVLEQISDMIDFGMNAAEAMEAPRFHHQWLPDVLLMERGMSLDTIALLKAKGQNVVTSGTLGSVATIEMADGLITGASDTRQRGTAAVGW